MIEFLFLNLNSNAFSINFKDYTLCHLFIQPLIISNMNETNCNLQSYTLHHFFCKWFDILWFIHDNMIRSYFHIPPPFLELHKMVNEHSFSYLYTSYFGYFYFSKINYLVETTNFPTCAKVKWKRPQNYNLLIIKGLTKQHKNYLSNTAKTFSHITELKLTSCYSNISVWHSYRNWNWIRRKQVITITWSNCSQSWLYSGACFVIRVNTARMWINADSIRVIAAVWTRVIGCLLKSHQHIQL